MPYNGYNYVAPLVVNCTAAVNGSPTVPVSSGSADYVVNLHLTGASAAAVWAQILDRTNFTDVAVFYSGSQIDVDIDQFTTGGYSYSNINLWFKVQAAIGAGNQDSGYSLAVGSASPIVKNNLANIYPFYDPFSGSTLNSSNWTNNGISAVVSGGTLTLSSSGGYPNLTGKVNFGAGYAVMAALTLPSLSGSGAEVDLAFRSNSALPTSAVYALNGNTKLSLLQDVSGSTSSQVITQAAGTQVWTVARDSVGRAWGSASGSSFTEIASSAQQNTNSLPVELMVNNASVDYNWVKVRPFVSSEPVVYAAQATIDNVFVSLTRGLEYNTDGDTASFTNTSDLLAAANALTPVVPITFALRYDAIVNVGGAGDLVSQMTTALAQGHEIAVCLEITPALCAAAGVTLNTSGSNYFAACQIMTLGYDQSDQRKLINTLMSAFFSAFGFYPSSAHAWMINTYSAQYLKGAYRCNVFGICRDQWDTDAYEIQGKPANAVYECSEDWLIAPAGPATYSDMAVFNVHWIDLLNNYGNPAEGYTTVEPVASSVGSRTVANYWEVMMLDMIAHPPQVGRQHAGIAQQYENSYSYSTYGSGFVQPALALLSQWAAAGTLSLTTATVMGRHCLSSNMNMRWGTRYRYNSVDAYNGTASRCLEVCSYSYRARFRWDASDAGITDLRAYGTSPGDPYLSTVLNAEQGIWRAANCIDGGYYSVTANRAAVDAPANNPQRQNVQYNPSGSTYYDLYNGSGTGGCSPTVTPTEVDGTFLQIVDANAGTITYDFRQLGYIVTGTVPALSGGKYYLAQAISSAVDPATVYYTVNGGAQQTYSSTSGTPTVTDEDGMDYLVIAKANTPAVTILFLLSVNGGTKYGATACASLARLGVLGNTNSGNMSFQVAVVPCLNSNWTVVLAALQEQGDAYLTNASWQIKTRRSVDPTRVGARSIRS